MSEHCTSANHASTWDLALLWAEAALRPYYSTKRSRVERIKLKFQNRNAISQRLAAAIALYSVLNAFETNTPALKWFRRWLRNQPKGS